MNDKNFYFSSLMSESVQIFSWKSSIAQPYVKLFLTLGVVLVICILSILPNFFDVIELRHGMVLNDWVLNRLPAINLSVPIFIVIWSMALLMAIRCIKNPYTLMVMVWSFFFLTLSRIITISLVPLDAPIGLILLKDPLSNSFYHGPFITKDLFYSGHTSTQFLMFLCLQKRWEKGIALFSTVAIGIMVLIQHVHYSVDVIIAPIGAYLAYYLAKNVADRSFSKLKL